MSHRFTLSRRSFFKAGLLAGISVYIAPWGQEAFAELFEEQLLTPVRWDPKTHHTDFRIDGIAKVTGKKIFAQDIRARDMPHWPEQQGHALIIRVPCADRIFLGLDLSLLGDDLQPDKIVTAADLARDGLSLPAFYGSEPFLAPGTQALYLGHPLAMLIYRDFSRFNSAKARLKFNESKIVRYGATVPFRELDPYASFRFVRVAGPQRQGPDVYSSVKNSEIFGHYRKHKAQWPQASEHGKVDEQGMAHAEALRQQLVAPPEDWLVLERHYTSQSIDQSAMEPDNSNGWYDAAQQTLHLVIASQSPAEVAESVADMLSRSRFTIKKLFIHPCHTVGYGSKDHSIFPLYGMIAALYGASLPVRLSNDRYEQFQATMKRHAFDMQRRIAVDRKTGLFQILQSSLVGNGGGRANFSPSVAGCAATSAQSIYYFPNNDIDVVCNYSRAIEAGSMRGYGTLQSMSATEMMVDELAQQLGMDAIELRLKNALRSGDLNSQGIAPGGAERIVEVLQKARVHPLWTGRQKAKAQYEASHPGRQYGVGFACVQKDFGTGAESSFARVELDPNGNITLYHTCTEIGTGMSTSQAVNCAKWLGQPASKVHTSLLSWPELPLKTSGDPYLMSQADQDRLAQDGHWTPALASGASASNSAYFNSHTTLEACRLIFRHGLWPAAMSVWGQGIEGGAASSYVVRIEDARWTPQGLTANGMEPLPLQRLAAIAHERGLLTGSMVHAFNRWQWAEASYQIDGKNPERLPLDGISLRRGAGPFVMQARSQVFYPHLQRNFAGVTYYSTVSALVELSVEIGTGEVELIGHHHVVDCGTPIVPELISGQLQGGVAMGIGHALYEYLPLYEDGPGNGTWNFNRYHLPRASEVAVWQQTGELLPPLSETDPSKGIAEVVMIPIIPAIVNAIYHATGQRFYDLPVSAEKIREKQS
jgi:CO/xanthine dehydrogenase Mo-binding subunit